MVGFWGRFGGGNVCEKQGTLVSFLGGGREGDWQALSGFIMLLKLR